MFRTLFDIVLRNNLTGQIVDSVFADRVFADRQASAKIDPHKKSYEEGSQEITKAFYKLNRSVNAANRITDRIRKKLGEDFENEKKLTISDQIEVIKDHLLYDYGWLSEDLTRVIFAILLFLETMPHEAENDCCDDAYYYLLLPHLEEIISTIRLRSGFLAFPLWYFENLKKMFEIRLELGFGRHGKKDISAIKTSFFRSPEELIGTVIRRFFFFTCHLLKLKCQLKQITQMQKPTETSQKKSFLIFVTYVQCLCNLQMKEGKQ